MALQGLESYTNSDLNFDIMKAANAVYQMRKKRWVGSEGVSEKGNRPRNTARDRNAGVGKVWFHNGSQIKVRKTIFKALK